MIRRVATTGDLGRHAWLSLRSCHPAGWEHLGLRLRLQRVEARGPEEFDRAFAAMAQERAEALLVSNESTFLVHRAKVAELTMQRRLPAMYGFRECVEAGGLMAYAVNMADFIGSSAVYVDRILKGAKPADLPIEQPMTFDFVVNLKTAQVLGLTFSNEIMLQVTEVIE